MQPSTAPATLIVSHPSALDKFEKILGVIGTFVQADAPLVMQLYPSPITTVTIVGSELGIAAAQQIAAALHEMHKETVPAVADGTAPSVPAAALGNS